MKSTLSTPSVLGDKRNDARRILTHHESLRRQADANAADRLAQVRRVAHEAEVEFVDGRRTDGLGIAQRNQLRAAQDSAR